MAGRFGGRNGGFAPAVKAAVAADRHDPGTKASKAAQYCSRSRSRSIRISCRAPGDEHEGPGAEFPRQPLHRLDRDHLVERAGDQQDRRVDFCREGFVPRLGHRPAGRIEPAEGRHAHGDLRRLQRHLPVPLEADRVARQRVVVEFHVLDGHRVAAGHFEFAEAERGHQRGAGRHRPLRGPAVAEPEQRPVDHHAGEAHPAVMDGAERDEAAGRMGEGEMRRRAVGQRHLLHEGVEVAVIFAEAVDMPLPRVLQPALGAALAAPVEAGDGKTAAPEVADRSRNSARSIPPAPGGCRPCRASSSPPAASARS